MTQTIVVKTLKGEVPAITSKSCLHRALISAALCSDGESLLCHTDLCRDTEATVASLTALGAEIKKTTTGSIVRGMPLVKGAPTEPLFCGESASTLRFLIPLLALRGGGALRGEGRLLDRSSSPIVDCLAPHGIRLSRKDDLLLIEGTLVHSGDFHLNASLSSQFTSGLLFALPLVDGESRILTKGGSVSRPYIEMTREIQRAFGFESTVFDGGYLVQGGQKGRACTYRVEGDWSNAAFFLAGGIVGSEAVGVRGLSLPSLQGDARILDALRAFGGNVVFENGTATAYPSEIRPTDIDATDIPDLVPILSVVAACANGKSVFEGVGRLRAKESDRIAAIIDMLGALGVRAESSDDTVTVYGRGKLTGGTVSSWGDHRLAMSASVAAIRAEGAVTVTGSEAVAKSYPRFFEDFSSISVKS